MNINIYGVGRSGTKAIQLFIAYLIAERECCIALNYEPYLWRSRKLVNYSYQGISNLFYDKHVAFNKEEISKLHQQFIKQLIKPNVSNVTKFIRANGYINAISEITNPDASFVVVRSIYDVLSSVKRTGFNFYSIGIKWEKSFWKSFVKQTIENGIIKENELIKEFKEAKEPIVKNAFYWYVMNLVALNTESSSTYFINFEKLDEIENKISDILYGESTKHRLSHKKFKGNNIHEDSPLVNINTQDKTLKSVVNKMIFYSLGRIVDRPFYFKESSGDFCKINPLEKYIISKSVNTASKVLVEKNSLFDYFETQISEKLKKAQL